MRWLKRKAYNDARSVLRKAGYEFDRLPPVLVGNLEVQKRGALHAHMALPYTTPLEMTFSRAFVDAMKRWAPETGPEGPASTRGVARCRLVAVAASSSQCRTVACASVRADPLNSVAFLMDPSIARMGSWRMHRS
jgi:hypothetical protein